MIFTPIASALFGGSYSAARGVGVGVGVFRRQASVSLCYEVTLFTALQRKTPSATLAANGLRWLPKNHV